jgi:putative copper export protein
MPTPQRRPFAVPKAMKQDRLNVFAHLLEAAYWFGIIAALMLGDVALWVWGVTAIIAIPFYAIVAATVRSRLGILR